jgi:hypothetical protein
LAPSSPGGRSSRYVARALLLAGSVALAAGCGTGREDRRLLIVTTDDVAGKTSPCGCHTPKGGLARRATFLDSVRAVRKRVLVVDAGGFFPATDDEREAAPFMLRAMATMGTQVAGVGANELRFGYAFARENAHSAGVPLVCANLVLSDGGLAAFDPWRVVEVQGAGASGIKVGVFGLIAESSDLGPARDSLRIGSAEEAARRCIRELRAQGANVVVLLSQLGKAMGDSVAAHVPGIDLLVGGGGVPAFPSGMPIGNGPGVVLHGGSEGWQVGVADVRFDARNAVRDIGARTIVLGPDVRTEPAMAASVKAFEDSLNAHLRARDAAFGRGDSTGLAGDHFVGMSNCIHCHAREYVQWRTTAHAQGWKALVDQHKESTPACLVCHVTGYGKPGGFRTADDEARFGNVQCEACHGMGSRHRNWTENSSYKVAEATCRGCHTSVTSPTFRLADYLPHVLHDPPRGLRPLPETPAHRLMREGKNPHGR